MKNQTLQVEGMSCNHCVNTIQEALRNIGVSGKVDVESGTVQVEYDESKVDLEKIKHEIEEQGYDVI